jgi:hypothetical protein
MALESVELTLLGNNGHVGKFRYSLAEGRGWDVRAEFDDRLLTARHCSDWHRVERLQVWLQAELWQPSRAA